jgi:hypothetical protein
MICGTEVAVCTTDLAITLLCVSTLYCTTLLTISSAMTRCLSIQSALYTHISLLYLVSCAAQEKHEAERYSIASELLSVKNEACDLELRLQEAQQGKVNRAK